MGIQFKKGIASSTKRAARATPLGENDFRNRGIFRVRGLTVSAAAGFDVLYLRRPSGTDLLPICSFE